MIKIYNTKGVMPNDFISKLLHNLKHQYKYEPKYQNKKDNFFDIKFSE